MGVKKLYMEVFIKKGRFVFEDFVTFYTCVTILSKI